MLNKIPNLRNLIFISFLFFCIECEAQTFNGGFNISSGVNVSTMYFNRNRLNYTPYPFLTVSKDIMELRKGSLSIGLNYIKKGGNEGLLVIDTNVWQSFYGDNLKYLQLNYLGLGLSYRKNIFKSTLYYELSIWLNYLISGRKYNYYYNHTYNQLTTEVNSIFDLKKEPFYLYKPIRFEKAIALNFNYKLPIKRTYISIGYELGLTSVFLIDTRFNHGILVGLKVSL